MPSIRKLSIAPASQPGIESGQGDADGNAPVSMGQDMAHAIPNCRATFYPGEGHLLWVDRMREILSALMSA